MAVSVLPGAEPYAHDGNDIGVLLVHGYTSTPQSMRGWAEHLAGAGFTVRLPRLPGHGTRWQDLNTMRWQDWYAEVDRAFAELRSRCDQVFVAGMSMGGLLSTKVALEQGPRVAGLILVNPIYLHDDKRLALLPVLQRVLPSFPGIANDVKMVGGEPELAYEFDWRQMQRWGVVESRLPPGSVVLFKESSVWEAYKWPILFFVAVGFWNAVGAGLLGFAINPPASLYYVQGLNMTPAHGHAALFGVYGMLGIGLLLFCLRGLYERSRHADKLLAPAYWGLNIGLAMMVFMSLLPAGIYQAYQSVTHGLWYARSPEIIHSKVMESLVWLRVPGDIVFALGALLLALYALKLLVKPPQTRTVAVGDEAAAPGD